MVDHHKSACAFGFCELSYQALVTDLALWLLVHLCCVLHSFLGALCTLAIVVVVWYLGFMPCCMLAMISMHGLLCLRTLLPAQVTGPSACISQGCREKLALGHFRGPWGKARRARSSTACERSWLFHVLFAAVHVDACVAPRDIQPCNRCYRQVHIVCFLRQI